jgi:hypothetical protein
MKRGRLAKESRRVNAEARQAEHAKRNDKNQLDKLINQGHGHCKEAHKLLNKLDGNDKYTVVPYGDSDDHPGQIQFA